METTGRFTLPRTHILRSKTDIDALLERGAVLFRYPIKAYYLDRETSDQVGFSRMMVSHSGRISKASMCNFKRAVKRNLLKRRVREAWRLNSGLLGDRQVDILFVYLGREIERYDRIEATLTGILRFLAAHPAQGSGVPVDSAR